MKEGFKPSATSKQQIEKLMFDGKFIDALKILTITYRQTNAIQSDDYYTLLYFHIICAYRMQNFEECLKKTDELLKLIEKVYFRNKNHVLFLKAYCLIEKKLTDKALAFFDELSGLPMPLEFNILKASFLYTIIKDYKSVIELLEKIQGETQERYIYLGLAYLRLGQEKNAASYLEQFWQKFSSSRNQINIELKYTALKMYVDYLIEAEKYADAWLILNEIHLESNQNINDKSEWLYLKARCSWGLKIGDFDSLVEQFIAVADRPKDLDYYDEMRVELLLLSIQELLKENHLDITIQKKLERRLGDASFKNSHLALNILIERDMAQSVYHYKLGQNRDYKETINNLTQCLNSLAEELLLVSAEKWIEILQNFDSTWQVPVYIPRFTTSYNVEQKVSKPPHSPVKKQMLK